MLTILFFAILTKADVLPMVQIQSYLGTWYEIARTPNKYQDNQKGKYGPCYESTANYRLLEEGKLEVKNTCIRKADDGTELKEEIIGKAQVIDAVRFSKLEVNFTGLALLRWLGIGTGNYWIYDVGPLDENKHYGWALVSGPNQDFLYWLHRSREVDAQQKKIILERAQQLGLPVERLKYLSGQ